MKVFITSLTAYNQGHLVGKWIQLPLSSFELSQSILGILSDAQEVCGSTGHEEVFITDYEADILINEHDDIYALNDIAKVMDNYSEDDLLKYKFLSYEGYNQSEVLENGIDYYEVEIHDYSDDYSFIGVYELLAYDLVQEGLFGDVPDNFKNYIDYSSIGKDLSYDYIEFQHGILGRII